MYPVEDTVKQKNEYIYYQRYYQRTDSNTSEDATFLERMHNRR